MMRAIVDAETPQFESADHKSRVQVPDRVFRAGLTIVESAEPVVTARGLASETGAELAGNLRQAHRAAKARVKAVDRERAVVRARQALDLAERLEPFDEEADATLILRRDELEAAATLGGEVAGQLTALHRKLDLLHLALHQERTAGAALEEAKAALSVDLPYGVDPVAISHARDGLLAADAECALVQQLESEAMVAEVALVKEVDPDHQEAAHAETAARRRLARSRDASRRLLGWAGLTSLVGAVFLAAAAAGVVSPVVGAGLALATLPTIIELLRRARGATVAGREEVERAEARTMNAAHRHLARLEAARRARREVEHRLADAQRTQFAAASRWSQVVGPAIGVDDASAAIAVATELARLRPAAESATAAAEQLRRSLIVDLVALGAPPELDPSDALIYIERLMALHPVAGSLLESVAEAEQRALQREQLASLAGSADKTTLRRIAQRRVVPLRRPLVIADDGDALLRPAVAQSVVELSGSVAIVIVSDQPARWQPAGALRPLPPGDGRPAELPR
jgi:hypothetical protein